MRSSLALLLLCSSLLSAQEPPAPVPTPVVTQEAPVEPPVREPAALALLDRADALFSSPRRDGLAELRFRLAHSRFPVVAEVTWKVGPDGETRQAKARALEQTPEAEAWCAAVGPLLEKASSDFLDWILGRSWKDRYAGDEVRLEDEGRIRVVARNPETRAAFREAVITFAETGLPTVMVTRDESGETHSEFQWMKVKEGYVVERATTRTGDQPSTALHFVWTTVEGFRFPSRVTLQAEGQERVFLDFDEYHVTRLPVKPVAPPEKEER